MQALDGKSRRQFHRACRPFHCATFHGDDRERRPRGRPGFTLESVHPGHDAAGIAAATGFAYETPAIVPETPLPDPATLTLLRGRVLDELAETYPAFAAEWRRDLAALAA